MQEIMSAMAGYSLSFTRMIIPEESASLILDVIDKTTIEENGRTMVSHLGTTR
jgi:hypothetical protein